MNFQYEYESFCVDTIESAYNIWFIVLFYRLGCDFLLQVFQSIMIAITYVCVLRVPCRDK